MRCICWLSGFLILSACASPEALRDVQISDDLTGSYTRRHVIQHLGAKDWEEATVRDTLSLSQSGDSLQVYLALVHTNYHICEMQKTAFRRGDGFESLPERVEFGETSGECVLRLTATADSIEIHDINDQCRRTYCGARGYIDGTAFPRQ